MLLGYKERDKRQIDFLWHINNKVLKLFLISALFVVLVRTLAPFPIGWDQSTQLEAGHRLIQGLGLSTSYTAIPNPNINKAPTAQYLNTYPPTLSLLVASALFFGIPLISFLKFLYGIVTVLGWIGWGILGSYCFVKPIRLGPRDIPLQYILAVSLPLFLTPRWSGTDLFLWAGVPFIIILLFKCGIKRTRSTSYLVIAGMLYGLLCSIRYASFFLVITAIFILYQVYWPRIKDIIISFLIFFFSSLVFIFPNAVYLHFVNGRWGLPKVGENFLDGYVSVTDTSSRVFASFSSLSVMYGFRPSEVIIDHIQSTVIPNYVYGAFWLVLIFSLPFILIKAKIDKSDERKKDVLVSLSLIQVSLVLFLIAAAASSPRQAWLSDPRYYVPAGPSGILILYGLVNMQSMHFLFFRRLLTMALSLCIVVSMLIGIYVVAMLMYQPKLEILGRQLKMRDLVQPVLGLNPDSYPAGRMHYPSNSRIIPVEDSLLRLKQLQIENPRALFYIGISYPYFVYDGFTQFRRIPPGNFWKQAYVDKAVKIFWLVDESCPTVSSEIDDVNEAVIDKPSFQSRLKTVAEFPHEGTKIVVCDLPGGYTFGK